MHLFEVFVSFFCLSFCFYRLYALLSFLLSLHHLQNASLSMVTDLQKPPRSWTWRSRFITNTHRIDQTVWPSIPVNFFHGNLSFLFGGTFFLPFFGTLFFLFFVFILFLFFPRLVSRLSGTWLWLISSCWLLWKLNIIVKKIKWIQLIAQLKFRIIGNNWMLLIMMPIYQ